MKIELVLSEHSQGRKLFPFPEILRLYKRNKIETLWTNTFQTFLPFSEETTLQFQKVFAGVLKDEGFFFKSLSWQ